MPTSIYHKTERQISYILQSTYKSYQNQQWSSKNYKEVEGRREENGSEWRDCKNNEYDRIIYHPSQNKFAVILLIVRNSYLKCMRDHNSFFILAKLSKFDK